MSNPAIKVEMIGKKYLLGSRERTLRDTLASLGKKHKNRNEFWALQDVSFEVQPGEIVGVIGRNGAGKSTLLKVLSRITLPTSGKAELNGRVASLLEVGTGFHPELTGRENIYLNGVILGMRYREIRQQLDEIIEFAGIEKFIDTPVKHYSSGMYVRLAFAVAAHLQAEILLIDEVLAVGDAEFQRKSLGKMDEVAKSGRTVIFVSHNTSAIAHLCKRVMVFNQGRIVFEGAAQNGISRYFSLFRNISVPGFDGPLAKKVMLKAVLINGENIFEEEVLVDPHSPLRLEVIITAPVLEAFRLTFSLFRHGSRLFTAHDSEFSPPPSATFKSVFEIPAYFLRPGQYVIQIGGFEHSGLHNWFSQPFCGTFTVIENWSSQMEKINEGMINVNLPSVRVAL